MLALQRSVGNRGAAEALRRVGVPPPPGGPVLRRSPLSDQLEATWTNQGKEPFFVELGDVRVSDPDVESSIERTLTGADLRRARQIAGTDRPLSDVQRARAARVSNGRLSFSRFIEAELRDMALSKAATTQPKGIQSVPWGPPYIFKLPGALPANAARH